MVEISIVVVTILILLGLVTTVRRIISSVKNAKDNYLTGPNRFRNVIAIVMLLLLLGPMAYGLNRLMAHKLTSYPSSYWAAVQVVDFLAEKYGETWDLEFELEEEEGDPKGQGTGFYVYRFRHREKRGTLKIEYSDWYQNKKITITELRSK